AGLLLVFDATRRTIGHEVALLVSALYAINPIALNDAGNLMSEAPFKLFLALALWGAVREKEGTRYAFVAGAGVILAALTRTAGVVFLPALAGYWLFKRRYVWVAGLALASIPVLAWIGFSFNAPDASDRRLYVADLRGPANSISVSIMKRLGRFIPQTRLYLTEFIPWTLALPTVRGTVVDNVIWLIVTIVLGAAGLIALIRRWTLAALFLVTYAALLMVWRFAFVRLVNPIVPLLLITLIAGGSLLASKFVPRYATQALIVLSALMLIGAGRRTTEELATRLGCDRSAPATSPACWPDPDRELLTLAHWVRDSTPADAVFFVSKERAFFVHSGRKSINQDRALREDAESIGDYLRSRGVSYTVMSPIGIFAGRHARLVTRACREFELVRQFSSRTLLLRVLPEPASTEDTATCAAARAYSPGEASSQ
ncbi:MAG TPA: glycosyltransferase family 39 protein, partial [Gemmatimonadaceae bacterium]